MQMAWFGCSLSFKKIHYLEPQGQAVSQQYFASMPWVGEENRRAVIFRRKKIGSRNLMEPLHQDFVVLGTFQPRPKYHQFQLRK